MNSFRVRVIVICGGLVIALMLFRMFALTYFDNEFLQARGSSVAERVIEVPTNRGIIYDRNGEPLALSLPVYSFWTDPGFYTIAKDDLPALAEAMNMTRTRLEGILARTKDTRFVYLKRRAPKEMASAVEELGLEGVRIETEYRRYYPRAEVSSHIVGLTNSDGKGIEGLEAAYNARLDGQPGKRRILRGRDGRRFRDLELIDPPVFGEDLTMTIDLALQYLTYKNLRDVVDEFEALSASALVIEVATGEILALANYPTFNPNDLRDRVPSRMRNRAIKDTYEPGSTIKPFSALAALETERYQPSSEIDTNPGYFEVGRKLVEDPNNYGVLTLEMVLVKSSQVGIAKIALDLEQEAVLEVLVRAGLNDQPMSGLPNESVGQLNAAELQREIGRANLAFGYGISVSPLQLGVGYLTLATGGKRREISIIRETQMRTVYEPRVFAEKDVTQLLEMLQGVTSWTGTAPKAAIPGFPVAGKTGTVRKITDGEYDDSRHIAWFAGMVPANDPQIVVVVAVNEPQGELFSGGGVAAPLFSKIAQHALQLKEQVSTVEVLDDDAS